jgi:hypothetical protein
MNIRYCLALVAAILIAGPAVADGITNPGGSGSAITAGQLAGTATNDNANAGNVGQLISSNIVTGSSVSLTTGTSANITSISLTAGDWDVSGICVASPNGATTSTSFICSISTTTATINLVPSDSAGFSFNQSSMTAGSALAMPTSVARFSLSATTTVFLVAQSTFATNTMNAYGSIRARRVR